MQHFASQIIGKSILSFHSGKSVGEVTKFYINQNTLKIDLLQVSNDKGKTYLLTNDIKSISYIFISINSADELALDDELIRYKQVIKDNFNIIGLKVFNEDNAYLGRIKDYTIDYVEFKLSKIHLKAPLLKRILNQSLIIDRSQLVKVKKDRVIVKSTRVKSKIKNSKVLQAKAN
jgi:sporulation protein YlmC with PRC-barrel domain